MEFIQTLDASRLSIAKDEFDAALSRALESREQFVDLEPSPALVQDVARPAQTEPARPRRRRDESRELIAQSLHQAKTMIFRSLGVGTAPADDAPREPDPTAITTPAPVTASSGTPMVQAASANAAPSGPSVNVPPSSQGAASKIILTRELSIVEVRWVRKRSLEAPFRPGCVFYGGDRMTLAIHLPMPWPFNLRSCKLPVQSLPWPSSSHAASRTCPWLRSHCSWRTTSAWQDCTSASSVLSTSTHPCSQLGVSRLLNLLT